MPQSQLRKQRKLTRTEGVVNCKRLEVIFNYVCGILHVV